MTLRHEFVVRTTPDRWTWRVLYGPEGEQREVAVGRWLIELRYPELTRERMTRNLNAGKRAPRRTWSALPLSEFQWLLCHNGRDACEVTWDGSVHRVDEWMVRIVAALNEDRGKADPFPEPKPPAPRHQYIRGDHDFSTGRDLVA